MGCKHNNNPTTILHDKITHDESYFLEISILLICLGTFQLTQKAIRGIIPQFGKMAVSRNQWPNVHGQILARCSKLMKLKTAKVRTYTQKQQR